MTFLQYRILCSKKIQQKHTVYTRNRVGFHYTLLGCCESTKDKTYRAHSIMLTTSIRLLKYTSAGARLFKD